MQQNKKKQNSKIQDEQELEGKESSITENISDGDDSEKKNENIKKKLMQKIKAQDVVEEEKTSEDQSTYL